MHRLGDAEHFEVGDGQRQQPEGGSERAALVKGVGANALLVAPGEREVDVAEAFEILPLLGIEDLAQHALRIVWRERRSAWFKGLQQAFAADTWDGAAAEEEVGSGHVQEPVEGEGDVHPASISADASPGVNRLARRSHWDVPCEGGRRSHTLLFDPAKSIWGQPPTPSPALGPASH